MPAALRVTAHSASEPDLGFDDMIGKLRVAAAEGHSLEAAQVQLLNLSAIAERTGRHWPQVRERIRESSLSFLKGGVRKEDVIIPCGDGFLIVFAAGNSADYKARCTAMQEALTAFYLGEEGLDGLRAQVQQKVMAPKEVAAVAAASEEERAHRNARSFGAHGMQYVPLYCLRPGAIVSNLCLPSFCEEGKVRWGYDRQFRSLGQNSLASYGDLDEALLKTATDALLDLHDREDDGVVGVSVHISTLRRQKSLRDYLANLAQIPAVLRQRLFVKVAEIDTGATASSISDFLGQLKRHVHHVALEHHCSDRNFERFVALAPWSVGFQLPPHATSISDKSLKAFQLYISQCVRAARNRGVRTFIDNAKSPELLSCAAAEGTDFATSETFWAPGNAPRRAEVTLSPSAQPAPCVNVQ